MALTGEIDNYPGYENGIDGFTLGERMQRQAERFGARTEYAQVERADLVSSPKVLETSEGPYYGKTVVLATGAGHRELGVENEEALTGRGVAYWRPPATGCAIRAGRWLWWAAAIPQSPTRWP